MRGLMSSMIILSNLLPVANEFSYQIPLKYKLPSEIIFIQSFIQQPTEHFGQPFKLHSYCWGESREQNESYFCSHGAQHLPHLFIYAFIYLLSVYPIQCPYTLGHPIKYPFHVGRDLVCLPYYSLPSIQNSA